MGGRPICYLGMGKKILQKFVDINVALKKFMGFKLWTIGDIGVKTFAEYTLYDVSNIFRNSKNHLFFVVSDTNYILLTNGKEEQPEWKL